MHCITLRNFKAKNNTENIIFVCTTADCNAAFFFLVFFCFCFLYQLPDLCAMKPALLH